MANSVRKIGNFIYLCGYQGKVVVLDTHLNVHTKLHLDCGLGPFQGFFSVHHIFLSARCFLVVGANWKHPVIVVEIKDDLFKNSKVGL